MPNYTPTTDVFGRFIEGLKFGQQLKEREEARVTKAQENELAKAKFGIDLARASGGIITSYDDFVRGQKALSEEKPLKTFDVLLGTMPEQLGTPAEAVPMPAQTLSPVQQPPVDPLLAQFGANLPYYRPTGIKDVPARTMTIPSKAKEYAGPAEVGTSEELAAQELARRGDIERFKQGFEALSTSYSVPTVDPITGNVVYKYSPAFGKAAIKTDSKETSGGGFKGVEVIPLSPEGLETAANAYIQTGQIPNVGMGGASNRVQIINRAGQILKERAGTGKVDITPLITNAANTKANTASLAQLRKQADNIMAFEKKANMDAEQVLKTGQEVYRTGMPVVNKAILAAKNRALGDKDIPPFALAIRTFINEYARITTSITGGSVTSDTARKEIEDLLYPNMTEKQLQATIAQAQVEMKNRIDAYELQFKQIDERMKKQVNPEKLKDPNTRLNELVTSGKSEKEAYKIMAQEGYK